MTHTISPAAHGGTRPVLNDRAVAALFTAAIFASAVLVFWIEPLFAKMILPRMGGAPAVWITALMFYQAVLFGGYLYAHLLTKLLAPAWQVAVHAGLFALACLELPPSLPAQVAGSGPPELQILLILGSGIGLPLLALSATAPLLQHWFGRSEHPRARDPYFLYAASNIGSLGALLAFPLLLEPAAGIRTQGLAWAAGFALTAVLVLLAGLRTRDGAAVPAPRECGEISGALDSKPWTWLLLAAIPSSLLSGTSARITADIAAGPLFWVVPLALYLVTFVLAFARRRVLPIRFALAAQPVLLVPIMIAQFGGTSLLGEWTLAAATLGFFFLSAYLCHLRLADSRPGASRLTEFYLYIAAGGLLGGTFNAVLAPVLFNDIWEFPLALTAAVALRPRGPYETGRDWRRDLVGPALLGAAVTLVLLVAPADNHAKAIAGVFVAPLLIAFGGSRLRLAAGVGVACLLAALPLGNAPALFASRNFFGIERVYDDPASGARHFMSGSTLHGMQSLDPGSASEPTSYYHRNGPLGDIFRALGERVRHDNVAVIGMGLGTVACYGPPGGSWRFYEINPAVIGLATDRRYFSFIDRCQPQARIVLGDGRLRFGETQQRNALIVLDAFSADAIPSHLLTQEAFEIYLERLEPAGLIAIHVSNRFVDLRPTLAAAAARVGVALASRQDRGEGTLARPSEWVVMSRSTAGIDAFIAQGWQPLRDSGAALWTDDHTDILGPLLARMRRAN